MEQEPIIITDDNYKDIQKLVSRKYYEQHAEEIINRASRYYEQNKEKVSLRNKEKYREIKNNKLHEKLQEKYNKTKEKYLKSLQICDMCNEHKEVFSILCDTCIHEKYGDNIRI